MTLKTINTFWLISSVDYNCKLRYWTDLALLFDLFAKSENMATEFI
jgi:hypothetical protein